MEIATTKERILQFIDYLGFSKLQFYEKTGMKRGFLDGDKLKTSIPDTFIATIIAVFPELNPIWLITGDGDMIKKPGADSETSIKDVYRIKTDHNIDSQHIPLYDLEAVAGLVPLFYNGKQEPVDFIRIPHLPKCDGAVYVTGDSMYPLLKSGDIVLYKAIKDIINNIFWGEMYLVSVDMDGEEYISVKYIQKSNEPNSIKLVSYNQHHADKDIPISKIRALALVKASIRINSMR